MSLQSQVFTSAAQEFRNLTANLDNNNNNSIASPDPQIFTSPYSTNNNSNFEQQSAPYSRLSNPYDHQQSHFESQHQSSSPFELHSNQYDSIQYKTQQIPLQYKPQLQHPNHYKTQQSNQFDSQKQPNHYESQPQSNHYEPQQQSNHYETNQQQTNHYTPFDATQNQTQFEPHQSNQFEPHQSNQFEAPLQYQSTPQPQPSPFEQQFETTQMFHDPTSFHPTRSLSPYQSDLDAETFPLPYTTTSIKSLNTSPKSSPPHLPTTTPTVSTNNNNSSAKAKVRKPRGRRVQTTDTLDSEALNNGKKLFICSEADCGRVFKRAEHLNRHTRMHSGERPYPCHECDKSFSRSDNLSAHISRTHKGSVEKIKNAQSPTPNITPRQSVTPQFTRPNSSVSMLSYNIPPSPALTASPSPRPMSSMSVMSTTTFHDQSNYNEHYQQNYPDYPELSYTPSLSSHTPALPSYHSLRDNISSPFQPHQQIQQHHSHLAESRMNNLNFTESGNSVYNNTPAPSSANESDYQTIYSPAPRQAQGVCNGNEDFGFLNNQSFEKFSPITSYY
ncbi:hypothetical protein HDU92_004723 [Lobulomyces angularis]|nr:hypothetical protein HDU92_004723 [Lobulomyces angularis]